jgi:hypothetical protein
LGVVIVDLLPSDTDVLGSYMYDVQINNISNPNIKHTVVKDKLIIENDVTKD